MSMHAMYPMSGGEMDLSIANPSFLAFGPFPIRSVIKSCLFIGSTQTAAGVDPDDVQAGVAVVSSPVLTQAAFSAGRQLWHPETGDTMTFGRLLPAVGADCQAVIVPLNIWILEDRFVLFKGTSDDTGASVISIFLDVDLSRV